MRSRNLARMMQPPRQMVAISPRSMPQSYSRAAGVDHGPALRVGDHLGRVQRLLDLVGELRRLGRLRARGAGQAAGGLALVGVAGQRAGEDRLGDAGDRDAQVEGVLHGPAAGALLLGLVEHDVDERLAGGWRRCGASTSAVISIR